MDFLLPFSTWITQSPTYIWGGVGVFIRISLLVFMLPGLGETTIPIRVRLAVGLWIAWLIGPWIIKDLVLETDSISTLVAFLIMEAVYGFTLGFGVRVAIYALQTAGTIIAQSMSLSQIFGNVLSEEPNLTISVLLMVGGTALAMTAGLHIEAVLLLQKSYGFFPLGSIPDTASIANWATSQTMGMLSFSVSLALPFVLLNFIYNTVLGLLSKAMPQLMVSFVGMPFILGAGLVLLAIASGGILIAWMAWFAEIMSGLVGR